MAEIQQIKEQLHTRKIKERKEIRQLRVTLTEKLLLSALELLKNGYTMNYVSELTGITINQLKYYSNKQRKHIILLICKMRPAAKVTQEHLMNLENYMNKTENCTATLSEIKRFLQQRHADSLHDLSIITVRSMLKKIKFSRKRLQIRALEHNSETNTTKRKEIITQFLKHINDGIAMVFIDESGFSTHTIPQYGYGRVGCACVCQVRRKTKNVTLISAITKDSILGIQIFKGGLTAYDYGAFLINLLLKHPHIAENRQNYCFYMDNAPIHHAVVLKPFYNHLNILFGAAYAPYLNPIEEYFGTIKRFELSNNE